MKWPEVRLGDVARELRECSASDDSLPVYSVTKHDGFVASLEYFSKQVFSRDLSSYKLVRKGQFAYATIHLDEGAIALLQQREAVLISPMYTVFSLDNSRVCDRFLLRLLKSPPVIAQYSTMGRGTVHRRKSIAFESLAKLRLFLPPLPEQRRIADILDKADSIRRKRKEAIALTEELLRSAFLEMFGDPVTNPKGWPVRELGSISTIQTGNTPPRAVRAYYGDEIEWVKSDNISPSSYIITEAAERLSIEGRRVARIAAPRSTIMTCIAGSVDSIGKVALVDREVAFNQQLNALLPEDDIDHRYFFLLLLFSRNLVQRLTTSSTTGMVNKSTLAAIRVPVAPRVLQSKIAEVFEGILRADFRMGAGYEAAESLQRALSNNYFG